MSSEQICLNKFVSFTYSITDALGGILESVDIPVCHVHGVNSGMFEKIELAMEGAVKGDRISVEMTPEEGFGLHLEELTFTDRIENVPEQYRSIGATVEMRNDIGGTKPCVVTKIKNGKLTLDGNHPFAGKQLTYLLNILEVRDATPEEIAERRPGSEEDVH